MESDPVPVAALRVHRFTSGFLIVAGVAHSIGHWLFYVRVSGFDPRRRALHQAMDAYVADELVLRTTMWDLLQMFSLSFSLLLFFAGISGLVLARAHVDPRTFRAMARFNAVFWSAALAGYVLLHPAIQPVVIAGSAAAGYLWVWWRLRVSLGG